MNPSILIVDDEPSILQSLGGLLSDEGFDVHTASNGYEALKNIESDSPDLVLLDIWMPDVDGITLLKEWAAGGRPPCPIVIMTGHGTLETAVEATRLGAHDFVQKPISLARLLAIVSQALESRRKPSPNSAATQAPSSAPIGSSAVMQVLRSKAEQAAHQMEIPLIVKNISDVHLDMVKNPRYGYGKNMNPCIDCHAMMFRLAGEVMADSGFDFLFSGEVLGQRLAGDRHAIAVEQAGVEQGELCET